MRVNRKARRTPRYRASLGGARLHLPSCPNIIDTPDGDLLSLNIAEAREWLARGMHRMTCKTCRPADPREVRLT